MKITKMFNACASAFGLSILLASAAYAQDTTIAIGSESGQVGQEIDLPVSLDANNHEGAGLDIHIEFDENELELRDGGSVGPCDFVDPGPALDEGQTMICSDEGGGRLFVGIDAPFVFPVPEISEGIMFFVRFTVAPTATPGATTDVTHDPDTVSVANTGGTAVDSDNVTIVNGDVEVLEAPAEVSVLNVQPTDINFGGQQTGTTSDPETVTVSNDGGDGVDLEITDISISGDFDVAGGTCSVGDSLSDGDSCTIDVTFSPSADGAAAGSLTVDSDADEVTNDTVALSGEGTEAPPPEPANLSIAPPSGDVNLGSGSAGDVLSTTAVISNNDSAEEDGTFTCTLDDPSGVFDASPLTGTVPGEDGSQDIDLSCTLPSDAEDGDSFGATFACEGSEGFSSEHALSCSVSEFEAVPVPTMQKWSLILFALMMLIAGGIGIRFFRA